MEENEKEEVKTNTRPPEKQADAADSSAQAGAHHLAALLDIQDKEGEDGRSDAKDGEQPRQSETQTTEHGRHARETASSEEAYSFRLSMAAAPFGPGSFIATVTSPDSVHLTNDRWDVVFSKPSASEVIRHFRGLASPGSWIPVAKSDKTEETTND